MANDGQRRSSTSHAASVGRERLVLAELAGDGDHVGVLEEHQPAVAVVVGERAERLGPQGHLRVELAAADRADRSSATRQ